MIDYAGHQNEGKSTSRVGYALGYSFTRGELKGKIQLLFHQLRQ